MRPLPCAEFLQEEGEHARMEPGRLREDGEKGLSEVVRGLRK